ncbi:MAG: hypothetical protein KA210_03985 [Bacteroidia bacterium]|nr:hypothetical protein [Bacteroidia bacterium]
MKKTIFKSVVILLTAITTLSCSEDGAMGPAGPAGANGTNGTNGTNGNANVIGSTTVSVPPSNWINAGGTSTSWSTTLTSQAITQAIVDKGSVSVFCQVGSTWLALPYSNPQNHYFFNYGFYLGAVEVNLTSQSGYTVTPGTNVFRIVVISASNKLANPNTNWKDYNQVRAALHLQD